MHILVLLFFSFFINAQEEQPQQNKQRITVQQIVLQTIVDQKTEMQQNPTELFGKKLVAYLNNLNDQEFKKTFAQLNSRAKVMYLFRLQLRDYERFLQRYTDKDWETFWSALTPEEQQHIPKTREEQLLFIRDAYAAYPQHIADESWFSLAEKRAPHSCDLEKFKELHYQDEHGKTTDKWKNRAQERHKFNKAYLLRKKLELLNMP